MPQKDRFFILSENLYNAIQEISFEWQFVNVDWLLTFIELSKLGICETRNPNTEQISYSGPSFLGNHLEIPASMSPLVLNCFCTSSCSLDCEYCYARDLMDSSSPSESKADIKDILRTTSRIRSMVGVVTGGEPLAEPDRAIELIEGLKAQGKAVVLDTSGVGNFDKLLPCLKANSVHVRVSLDSIIGSENDRWRHAGKSRTSEVISSIISAENTIDRCVNEELSISVQTVIHNKNRDAASLRHLRDWLIAHGVNQWVLHMIVRGGAARLHGKKLPKKESRTNLIPKDPKYVAKTLLKLINDVDKPISIRCTDTANTPNSVLLVGNQGDLLTEGYAHHGKVRIYKAQSDSLDVLESVWPNFDLFGHTRRYTNWNPWFYEKQSLETLCRHIPLPSLQSECNGNQHRSGENIKGDNL